MPKPTTEDIRKSSEALMKCRECGSFMLICSTGLVCNKGCGKIVLPYPWKLSELRRAWPGSACEPRSKPADEPHQPAAGQAVLEEAA
jgi:hypothetical protein